MGELLATNTMQSYYIYLGKNNVCEKKNRKRLRMNVKLSQDFTTIFYYYTAVCSVDALSTKIKTLLADGGKAVVRDTFMQRCVTAAQVDSQCVDGFYDGAVSHGVLGIVLLGSIFSIGIASCHDVLNERVGVHLDVGVVLGRVKIIAIGFQVTAIGLLPGICDAVFVGVEVGSTAACSEVGFCVAVDVAHQVDTSPVGGAGLGFEDAILLFLV